jgi:hypothetical protein
LFGFQTAYFVIPEDIKHGTELYCSYFACRNAGIKFRYCVYCKLPVAKRNFAKRHRHTGKISSVDLPRDLEESSEGDELSGSEQGSVGMKSLVGEKKEAADTLTTAVTSQAPKQPNGTQWEAQELLDLLMARNVQELQPDGSIGTNSKIKSPLNADMLDQLLKKKQGDWDQLLLNRPRTSNDPSAMASWLLEVLRVSDVEKTTVANSGGDVTSSTAAGVSLASSSSDPRLTAKARKPGLKKKKRKLIQKATTKPFKEDATKKKKFEKAAAKTPRASNPVDAIKEKEIECEPPKPPATKKEEGDTAAPEMEAFENEDTDVEREEVEDDHDKVQEAVPAEDADDDLSTSSEDSVDLRASKKART